MQRSPSFSSVSISRTSHSTTSHTSLIPSQVIHSSTNLTNISQTSSPAIGDCITSKASDHIRLILQNPNGISADNDLFAYQLCLDHMKSASADIILLPETNLRWNHYEIQRLANSHRRNIFSFSKQITSNSTHHYESHYQPGGTCTILTDNTVGRFHSSMSDSELGRWSISTINMKRNQRVSIICCYQVCRQTISTAGPKTAFSQQWSILANKGCSNPNPRKQFYQDLDTTIQNLRQQDHLIILAGDFNSTIGDEPAGLDKIVQKHSLTDAIQHLHGPYECATYSRGSKCIDYFLVSSELLPCLRRGGILPFDAITMSDHRGLFIDLNMKTLFGSDIPSLLKPPSRSLHSTHPHRRQQYIDYLYQGFRRHRIFQRMSKLHTYNFSHPSVDAINLLEAIDRDITRLMLASEKRIRRPSPSPFSSTLAQVCIKLSLFKAQFLHLRHGSDKSRVILRLQSKLKQPIPLPTNLHDLKEALRTTRTEVRTIRRNAIAHREEFLLSRELDKSISKVIKRIRKAEEMKRGFMKLRFSLSPSVSSLVTYLEIPCDDTPPKQATQWKRVTDPNLVEATLYKRNVNHFQAAHGSPFTINPVLQDFDWQVSSPQFEATLQGNPPIYDDLLLNKLLRRLKRKVAPTCPTLTTTDFIRRIRRWRESTTTSPSGRHLGHYRSLLPPPTFDQEEYDASPEGQILSVHLQILNFCAQSGHSLTRWHNIVTMVIPKEHNNFKIHRLRVIHLYEADLTALFSTWSRRMITASHNHLNEGSYGARPGKSSIDPAFITLLQTEIAAVSRTNLVLAPNDAAQCYDRIVPNHALLSCMSNGMPTTAARCIGNTLLNAKYFLKTALQQSTTYWSHSPTTPVYGTGQGSGISPGVCCSTYSDLFDVHSKLCSGSTYNNPISTLQTTIHNIGFVDDTTTSICDHSHSDPMSLATLITTIKHDLQCWANLLSLTGGALELAKTELYLLHWHFSSSGFPCLTSTQDNILTLTSSRSNQAFPVISSSPSSSFKLLGFHIAPDQNMETQFSVLRKKAHKIAYAVSGSSVTSREAFLAYFAIYCPALSYVLPLTTFNKKQCHRIHSTPTQIFLQKAGFASTMHRDIVFGARADGGLGFRNLFVEQGISHVLRIVQTLRTPGQSQVLLRIAIDEWQINSGFDTPLLYLPSLPCPHAEGSWLNTTRQFLAEQRASIEIDGVYLPSPLRDRDQCLMSVFASIKGLGRTRLRRLNYCRLYLGITFLSELVDASGCRLHPSFWTGDISARPGPPLHRYPRQALPDASAWTFWRHAIRKCFCYPRSIILRQPLGLWLPPSIHRYPRVSTHPLRLWTSPQKYHTACRSTPTSMSFRGLSHYGMCPNEATPVDILRSTRQLIVTTAPIPSLPSSPTQSPPASVSAHLRNLEPWQLPLLRHLHMSIGYQDCAKTLSLPCNPSVILGASDGSVSDHRASFGWTLRDSTTTLATCRGPVDGLCPTSYRAEAVALLSLLLFLDIITTYPPFDSSTAPCLPIYSDSKALLQKLDALARVKTISPATTTSAEYDVIAQLRLLQSHLQLNVSLYHVKGHQDKTTPISQLPIPAQANCAADQLAGRICPCCPSSPRMHLLPAAACQVHIRNRTITHHLASAFRRDAYQSALRLHILRSRAWDATECIDWNVFGSLCTRHPHLLNFYTKLVHRLLPVGRILHRRSAIHSPNCPACGHPEDHDHWIVCDHDTRTHEKRVLLSTLRRFLTSANSDPILCDLLLEGVNSALLQLPFPCHRFPDRYQTLIRQQSSLGWTNFLRGFVTTQWSTLHLQYLQHHSIDPTKTPSLVLNAVSLLWSSLHRLWKFRNAQRHSKDLCQHQMEIARQAQLHLSNLYRLRHQVMPIDRALFRSSLDAHLQESLSNIQAWLHNHSSYLENSHIKATQSNLSNTSSIASYFRPL